MKSFARKLINGGPNKRRKLGKFLKSNFTGGEVSKAFKNSVYRPNFPTIIGQSNQRSPSHPS